MKFLKRLWDLIRSLFETTSDEVATPVATTPEKPVGEAVVKPQTYVPGTIPTSVDMISFLSRAPNSKWPSASQAVMQREYALKDGKEWDAYLKGEVKWPYDLLGPGGPGKQPWE